MLANVVLLLSDTIQLLASVYVDTRNRLSQHGGPIHSLYIYLTYVLTLSNFPSSCPIFLIIPFTFSLIL